MHLKSLKTTQAQYKRKRKIKENDENFASVITQPNLFSLDYTTLRELLTHSLRLPPSSYFQEISRGSRGMKEKEEANNDKLDWMDPRDGQLSCLLLNSGAGEA